MAECNVAGIVVNIITKVLLLFVIFSIGFAVGKEFSRTEESFIPEARIEGSVVVYYLRSSFRCWQCNMIEVYTEEIIQEDFNEQTEAGLLEWRVVDYLQNRELADRYNISGNTVVVTRYEDGDEISYILLDQVMEKVLNYDEFMEYVREAINDQLSIITKG